MARTFNYLHHTTSGSLHSIDLREELQAHRGAYQAGTITIYDNRPTSFEAEFLYLPEQRRLGIAWGADATWANIDDLEPGIEMWLNDPEKWEARN